MRADDPKLPGWLEEAGWGMVWLANDFQVFVPRLAPGVDAWTEEEMAALEIVVMKLFQGGESPPFTIGGEGSVEAKKRQAAE